MIKLIFNLFISIIFNSSLTEEIKSFDDKLYLIENNNSLYLKASRSNYLNNLSSETILNSIKEDCGYQNIGTHSLILNISVNSYVFEKYSLCNKCLELECIYVYYNEKSKQYTPYYSIFREYNNQNNIITQTDNYIYNTNDYYKDEKNLISYPLISDDYCNNNYGLDKPLTFIVLNECKNCKYNEILINSPVYDILNILNPDLSYYFKLKNSNCDNLTFKNESNFNILSDFSFRMFGVAITNTIYPIKEISLQASCINDKYCFNSNVYNPSQNNGFNKNNKKLVEFKLKKDKRNLFYYNYAIKINFPFYFEIVDSLNHKAFLTINAQNYLDDIKFILNDNRTIEKNSYNLNDYALNYYKSELKYIPVENKNILQNKINNYFYNRIINNEDYLINLLFNYDLNTNIINSSYKNNIKEGYLNSIILSISKLREETTQCAISRNLTNISLEEYVAIPSYMFKSSERCNLCVEILCLDSNKCKNSTNNPIYNQYYINPIKAIILDECSSCNENNISISPKLFYNKFNIDLTNEINVKWKMSLCDKSFIWNDNSYHIEFSNASNELFISILISNYLSRITRVDIRQKYTELVFSLYREYNNYWSISLKSKIGFPFIINIYEENNNFGSIKIEKIQYFKEYIIKYNNLPNLFIYQPDEIVNFKTKKNINSLYTINVSLVILLFNFIFLVI